MSQSGSERVYAIDLARGLAVMFMIWVHVLVTFSAPEVLHSTFGIIIGFLGSPPAAPVFMALMGVSVYYSRNKSLLSSVQRGLRIILLGYLLNILRGVLPVLLVKTLSPAAASRIPAEVANLLDAFLEIDILQFAGLALIAMALIREIKLNRYFYLVMALVIAVVSPLLWGKSPGIPVIDHLVDYLWGDKPSAETSIGNLVSFPFFPWFTFPLVGMFLGEALTGTRDLQGTFKKIGIAGFLLLLASSIFLFPNLLYQINDYYHSRPIFIIWAVAIVLVIIYICNLLVEKIKMNFIFDILFDWSRNITSLYFIQWVLIMTVADAILGFHRCSYLLTVCVMLFMMIASHFVNKAYLRIARKAKPAGQA